MSKTITFTFIFTDYFMTDVNKHYFINQYCDILGNFETFCAFSLTHVLRDCLILSD